MDEKANNQLKRQMNEKTFCKQNTFLMIPFQNKI